ncbi:MAG: FAD-binding oxidoreductase [Tissierellia bacterium]|nr:FAD-binding oxidoreductase [Tissierellia bacterium]
MKQLKFAEIFGDYLRDESRQIGTAESILFSKTEEEIVKSIIDNNKKNIPITTQGARTGLAASAVPNGGHIINLSRMNKVLGARYDKENDRFFLRVQPGVLLIEVRKYLANKSFIINDWDEESKRALKYMDPGEWFYSTDPTETSASIGGMVACNASGAKSFKYGSTRDHIESIRIVLSDGDILSLKRGEVYANDGKFELKTEKNNIIKGILPNYTIPNVKKNTAGYYCKPNMDLIDLFIGSDGTLGVISEIEIELNRTQAVNWGLTMFMPDEDKALDLVRALRGEKVIEDFPTINIKPSAIELFNHNALNMLREQQKINPAFALIQEVKESYHTGIYIEIEGDSNEEVWSKVQKIGNVMMEIGGDESSTWVAKTPIYLEKLHAFRHACPECVNMKIDEIKKTDPRITKLGTDMSVPNERLKDVMHMYNDDLKDKGLKSVIFGHIGDNHLHVNIIPRNIEEYNIGKKLYEVWAEKIASMGGAVSAEHGVGKLKIPFLQKMYNEEELNEMRKLKKIFDPKQLLNRGTIFPYIEGEAGIL